MISVVIPVFNCEKYLDSCLADLFAQTYKDIEIILVNDGSTDKSLELCRKYEAADSRVRVISKEKSGGAGPARNDGMDLASGEFIMFIDADDRLAPNMLERLVYEISHSGCDVAVCGYQTYIEGVSDTEDFVLPEQTLKGEGEVRDFFAKYFPEGHAGYLWNKLYRLEVIRKNGVRFCDMRRMQDGVFNIDFFNIAKSCRIIGDILYFYRINAQTDMFRKCPKNYFELVKRFTLEFLNAKKAWGDYSNEKIYTFFINELGTCVENAFSPQWAMTSEERRAYFTALSKDDLLNEIYPTSCPPVGKYRRKLVELLVRRNYTLIRLTVTAKLALKTSFKPLFYRFKRGSQNGKG